MALLLVSANFLESDFLQDTAVPKLLQRREQAGLKVIPVLLRSCFWQALPWLHAIKPLPASGQPIASFQGDDRDRVLAEIAAEIAQNAETLPVCSAAEHSSEPVGLGIIMKTGVPIFRLCGKGPAFTIWWSIVTDDGAEKLSTKDKSTNLTAGHMRLSACFDKKSG